MNAARPASTSLLATLLAALLVAGPGLAQDDFEFPEGDFEFPEGDYDAPQDAAPAEPSDVEPQDADEAPREDEDAPPRDADERLPAETPEMPDASEATQAQDTGPTPRAGDLPPAGERVPAGNPRPRSPVVQPSPPRAGEPDVGLIPDGPARGPLVESDVVALPAEQPPEAEGGDGLVWVATGVGTVLGVAVVAALGVGGALWLGADFGPKGSITVTPQ